MKRRTVTFAVVLLLLAAAGGGCGPTRAASALSEARDVLYQARLAGAHEVQDPGRRNPTKAQYNYLLAVEYVEKAKVFQGFSEFDAAESFASKAAALARDAIRLIEEQKRLITTDCGQKGREVAP